MRIAVIGSGIAGLASAWLLSRQHEVALFEANDYLGGHTHTHAIELDGHALNVDTGFIVHNPMHYPLLTRLFAELEVETDPTTMSFAVRCEANGVEYNAASLASLFCQRRNLLSPRFLGMVRDIFRFYRIAPALLHEEGPGPTLGEYVAHHNFGGAFCDEHLVPMASALWSSPPRQVLEFPAKYLVQFMANHQMLQVTGRPEWRVVRGGSARYVDAMRGRWSVGVRLSSPVNRIRRLADGVRVFAGAYAEIFDQVVLACHSDQALALLVDADERETDILGAIDYQDNDVVLHTDARMLPRHPKARAAWNVHVPRDPGDACTVSYCMNLLQHLDTPHPVVVTLNRRTEIDPSRVLKHVQYRHPVYTTAAVAAQRRRMEIQGRRRTWFAGAYWGWGFHEDGMRSAVEVAQDLGVRWCDAQCDASTPWAETAAPAWSCS
ncbi:NAD(P)/FAD-dependent oxidoreductase [Lysobacter niabensis]|uniref:NAD(P)/FAD-dependent oxidoreductase n=1 Tax=Agrilutibacter niabensis TaxID=380628 RepID=UPI0036060DD2